MSYHLVLLMLTFSYACLTQECSLGCSQCVANSTQCAVECSLGYYSFNGVCFACPANCATCASSTICTQCFAGFQLTTSSSCEANQIDENNIALILYVVVGVVSLVGLLVWVIFYCCRQREEQGPIMIVQLERQNSQVQMRSNEELSNNQPLVIEWRSGKREPPFNYKSPCSICLSKKVNLKTSWGHGFHTQCVAEWLKRHSNCPNCRSQDVYPCRVYCEKCHKKYFQVNRVVTSQLNNHKRCRKCLRTRRSESQR